MDEASFNNAVDLEADLAAAAVLASHIKEREAAGLPVFSQDDPQQTNGVVKPSLEKRRVSDLPPNEVEDSPNFNDHLAQLRAQREADDRAIEELLANDSDNDDTSGVARVQRDSAMALVGKLERHVMKTSREDGHLQRNEAQLLGVWLR